MLLDARRWGQRVHVVQGSRRMTFQQHERAVAQVAECFRGHGVDQGARVMLLARNRMELGISFWAAQSLGALVILGNPWWNSADTESIITRTAPVLILVDETTKGRVPDGFAAIEIERTQPDPRRCFGAGTPYPDGPGGRARARTVHGGQHRNAQGDGALAALRH